MKRKLWEYLSDDYVNPEEEYNWFFDSQDKRKTTVRRRRK